MVTESSGSAAHPNPVELPAWERQTGEKTLWFRRFQLFLWMGWKRSIYGACLVDWEMVNAGKEESEKSKKPTGTPGAWREAAYKFNWVGRAEAWDAYRAASVEKNVKEAWEKLAFLLPGAVERLAEVLNSSDEEQKRLAATSLLQRGFTLWGGGDPADKPKEIQFVEFV